MAGKYLNINFEKLINLNLIKRALSAVFFVPLIILPIILGGYYLVFVYLIILTFVMNEILDISKNIFHRKYVYSYFIITIIAFIYFIIQLLTKNVVESFLLIILTIWIFDTFSYIGGTILNGKKIFPKISKGKTYSGLISGFIFVVSFYYILESTRYFNNIDSICYFILICILAFIGDTIVSMIKRSASIKDSSNTIPGHGGVLDRMDSFIFVFFILSLLEIFL
tara:strand:- start:1124 stop:1795 length:672 start_codon:yes stop_codon:yes gene_type:complete